MEKEVIIPLSKIKILLVLLGSMAFIVGGVALFSAADEQSRYPPLFVQIVAAAGVATFSLAGIFSLKKVFDHQPGLVINQQGITDNSSGTSVGLIPWTDISGVETAKVALTKFLIIQLHNPEHYLDRSINPIQKQLLKANYKKYGSPISISVITLKVKFQPLLQILREAWEVYKY